MNFCIQCGHTMTHSKSCPAHPHAGKDFLNYPDGVGDVRFHRLDGETVTLKRVLFDSISSNATNTGDLCGDFESGDMFHVPFVAWWEVIYE